MLFSFHVDIGMCTCATCSGCLRKCPLCRRKKDEYLIKCTSEQKIFETEQTLFFLNMFHFSSS